MSTFTEKLEKIIIDYSLDECYPRFQNYLRAKALLNELFSQYGKNEKVLLIASSEDDICHIESDANCAAQLDHMTLDIYSLNKISIDQPEQYRDIIVVSNLCYQEISNELFLQRLNHICLYDFFRLHSLSIYYEYYKVFGEGIQEPFKKGYKEDLRYIVFYDRKKFQQEIRLELKGFYLKKIIFDFLYLRDFIGAETYIEQMRKSKYPDYERYLSAWQEIKKLLSQMEAELASRSHEDIFVFLFDSLENMRMEQMPFLKSLSQKSLNFINAYTVTPWTNPTFRSIFCEKKTVDDRAYRIRTIDEENSPLLKMLKDSEITFQYFGEIIMFTSKHKPAAISTNTAVTQIFWEALNSLCANDKRVCYWMHTLTETHAPFLTPDIETERITWQDNGMGGFPLNAAKACTYVDRQLQYYHKFFPSDSTKIFMGDHGWKFFERFHPVLFIQSSRISPQTVSQIFSTIHFRKLLEYILNPQHEKDFTRLTQKCVDIQDLDFYSGDYIARIIRDGMHAKSPAFFPRIFMGYKGLVTAKEFYIRYNSGEEVCFRRDDLLAPVSDARVEELRLATSEYGIDRNTDDHFKYSRYIYQVLEKYKKRVGDYDDRGKRKFAAINTLFSSFREDQIVAIRTGGHDAFELIQHLSTSNKQKIKGVIDLDPNCVVSGYGITVFHPECIREHKFNIIVYPGTTYREQLLKEIQGIREYCETIDLLDYLSNLGIQCSTENMFNFYDFEPTDFDVGFPFHNFPELKYYD